MNISYVIENRSSDGLKKIPFSTLSSGLIETSGTIDLSEFMYIDIDIISFTTSENVDSYIERAFSSFKPNKTIVLVVINTFSDDDIKNIKNIINLTQRKFNLVVDDLIVIIRSDNQKLNKVLYRYINQWNIVVDKQKLTQYQIWCEYLKIPSKGFISGNFLYRLLYRTYIIMCRLKR